jgi:hypothetical protein
MSVNKQRVLEPHAGSQIAISMHPQLANEAADTFDAS